MNKTELIAAMSAKSGLSKKDAGAALDVLISTITDTELLSMGYENLYTGERKYFDKAPEMRDWLLGLIAMVD